MRVLLGLVCHASGALAAEHAAVPGQLSEDGRFFRFTAPGVTDFTGEWSAVVEVGGRRQELQSREGVVTTGAETRIQFSQAGVDLLFRLDPVPGDRGVTIQAGIRNTGTAAVHLVWVMPVTARFNTVGDPKDWLLTQLCPVPGASPPVVSLQEIAPAVRVNEYGGLYRRDGDGFLFGPVGTPVAYVNTLFKPASSGAVTMRVTADMDGVRVGPGEERWGQPFVLLAEPPRQALADWAEWVAESHGSRTRDGALSGWSSWEFMGRQVTGTDVLAVAEAVLKSPDQLRPAVIQIDAGYEDPAGRASTNDKFPEALSFYAQRIAATGARPGLFLDLLDKPSRTFSTAERARQVRDSVEHGFTYLKLLYRLSDKAADGQRTRLEIARDNYAAIRQAAGEQAYLLAANSEADRAQLGVVDACRTAANVHRQDVRARINGVLRSYHLQGRWFAIDNDGYFMGTDIANVSQIAGGWPLVRTWMSMVGLSCGAAITSDPWQRDSFRPYWRNVEVMTPPARERTEVLDLCTSEEWPRLVGHVRRDWGDFTVALLWNPGDKEQAITLDFARAGMDPGRRHAVWSFWEDRYLGVAKESWTTPKLGAAASQHLVFTPLDESPSRPVLIGSDLHIYCGAAEIERVQASRSAMTIELTDAGAREGALFVYSRYPPVLRSASGCAADGIASAGENVWRINLHDRKSGVPQRIELAVLLPLTRQAWFWLLIATVLASLLFGAWRYLMWQRAQVRLAKLEQQIALDRERSRIARDIHDEIGANLTHISILSTLAAKPATDPAVASERNAEVASVARQTIQAFDEIIWSINPRNDTLQNLSQYICRRAEEILTPAQVACRCTYDEAFPAGVVPPQARHGLLLAVKEALHNIIKHAGAQRVDVSCRMEGPDFVVRVSDDGQGFEEASLPKQARARPGHGLDGMRQRMAELGGACGIESQPGGGTTIVFRLPVGGAPSSGRS